jgi:hypothetical protein
MHDVKHRGVYLLDGRGPLEHFGRIIPPPSAQGC